MAVTTVPTEPRVPGSRRADLARRHRDLLWGAIRDHHLELSPSLIEDQLQRELGVGRQAVREALGHLRHDGRIDRVQGLGTFATADRLLHRCDRLHGFEDSIEAGAARVTYRLLCAEEIGAPPVLQRALELRPGEHALLLERVTLVDGRPASLRSHWLPGRFVDIFAFDLEVDFYTLVERDLGQLVGEGFMVIDAIGADDGTSALLDVALGAPLLLVQNTTRLLGGELLQLSFARTRSDRAALCSESVRPTGSRAADGRSTAPPYRPDHGGTT